MSHEAKQLAKIGAIINAAADDLRSDNVQWLHDRIAFYSAEIPRLEALVKLTPKGTTQRHMANLREIDARFALLRHEIELEDYQKGNP